MELNSAPARSPANCESLLIPIALPLPENTPGEALWKNVLSWVGSVQPSCPTRLMPEGEARYPGGSKSIVALARAPGEISAKKPTANAAMDNRTYRIFISRVARKK
jgi:hypothetical protein